MADETSGGCPNCNGAVSETASICRNCGLNVRTGETYDMRIRKAKGARDPQPPLASRLALLILVAFGLVIFAGFMYQRRMVDVIRGSEDLYRHYVERLESVDGLISLGEDEKAYAAAEELLSDLESEREGLAEDEKAERALLGNIIAKTLRHMDTIAGRRDE